MTTQLASYGTEKIGCLKKAMLHCPVHSLKRITETNLGFYLFDMVPDYNRYLEEHSTYKQLLTDNGVEVFELSDYIADNRELMSYLPNLAYLNDIAVVTVNGAVVSTMCPGGRQYEEIVVKEALTALGVPILHECGPGEQFEGFVALSPDSIFVADTERHSGESIERFISFALQHYPNIIYTETPQARRFMHPDMIFGRISDELSLFYPPAFLKCWQITETTRLEIDFKNFMEEKGIQLLALSDEEQQNWGTSFVTLKPNHIVNYDISLKAKTQRELESRGVHFTQFHPDAILAGGGSLRCLTLRLLRE